MTDHGKFNEIEEPKIPSIEIGDKKFEFVTGISFSRQDLIDKMEQIGGKVGTEAVFRLTSDQTSFYLFVDTDKAQDFRNLLGQPVD